MTLNLSMPNAIRSSSSPRITVVGVGGAGGNAVNNMIRSNLEGVEFIVANTDAQALAQSLCAAPDPAGLRVSPTGSAPARVPMSAAPPPRKRSTRSSSSSQGSNMVFITAGMGGGTGTGAAPVIARGRPRAGHPDRRRRDQALPFRRAAPHADRRRRHPGTAAVRRYADHHPEPEPVPHRQREDDLRRRLQDGRRRAAFRRARRHRSDGEAGPDQSRLRRHPRGHDRDGQGDDGHRRGRGRRTAPSTRPRRRSPTRCSTMSR